MSSDHDQREPPPAGPSAPVGVETELHARFIFQLRLIARRALGEASEADDVAQETLRRVVEALRAGRVQDLVALPAFVHQTARHLCQQRRRSAGRARRAFERLRHEPPRRAGGPGALEDLIAAERATAVRRALAALPEADRELLRLAFVEALDSAEIGRRLGLEPGAVRVRKHRAVRQLQEQLERGAGNERNAAGTSRR